MNEICNAQCGEAAVAAPWPGRTAGTEPLLVEDVRDRAIDVVVEELVDELDDSWRRLHLLRRRLGIAGCKRFGLAALEADVDFGDTFRRQFDQRGIFDDVGEQPFALAVRCTWIVPEILEVRRHSEQTLVDRIVQQKPILLKCAFSFFSRQRQRAQLVVPFRFERVGDETIARIGQHETAFG